MTMILDVCGALAALLEPDPVPPATAPERVVLDVEPFTWEAGKLYVYPGPLTEVPFETGRSRRQEFEIFAVFVTSNKSEEAKGLRNPELAEELDAKRGAYLAVVRANQASSLWGFIRGRVDDASPRTLDNRSASIRVNGWRIIGG